MLNTTILNDLIR